jgi:hypothetical protein
MAKVIVPPGGDTIAAPTSPMNAPAGAFERGNGLVQLGRVGAQYATEVMDDQLRREEQQAHVARKIAAVNAKVGIDNTINDLTDKYRNGLRDNTISPDVAQADFTKEAQAAVAEATKNLHSEDAALIRAEAQGRVGLGANHVGDAVVAYNQRTVLTGLLTAEEQYQRLAQTDIGKAEKEYLQTLNILGPQAGLQPNQIAERAQKFRENIWYTKGYALVSAARDDRKALRDAERQLLSPQFDAIDPQRKAVLLDRVNAYGFRLDQQAELAAQRAQREWERRLKQAEAVTNTFQAMADKGTVLDPNYIDQAMQATQGTPYQAAIVAMAKQAREVGGLAAQPIVIQQRALDEINALIAQRGRSPDLDRRKDQIERALRGSVTDAKIDPLRAGLERGVITDLKPLDLSGGIGGIVTQLRDRVPLAQRVSVWAGKPVSPLTEDEAATLKTQMDALPAKERSAVVSSIAAVVGPDSAQGMAAQLNGKDKALALAFAYAGQKTTAGRFTSELLLKGQQAQKDGTSTRNEKQPELKVQQWSAHIADELQDVYPAQTLTDQTREAALLIAHGIASEAGGQLSKNDLDRAVRLAIGGSIVEYNGRKVPLPGGVSEDTFNQRLRSVSADELRKQAPEGKVIAGGVAVPVEEFVKTLPGQQYLYAGPGRYAVLVGGRPVLNAQRKPVIIGVQ